MKCSLRKVSVISLNTLCGSSKALSKKDSPVEYTVIFNGQDKMTFTVPQIYEEKDKLEPDTQIQGTVY